jgi:hypothetical protein
VFNSLEPSERERERERKERGGNIVRKTTFDGGCKDIYLAANVPGKYTLVFC